MLRIASVPLASAIPEGNANWTMVLESSTGVDDFDPLSLGCCLRLVSLEDESSTAAADD